MNRSVVEHKRYTTALKAYREKFYPVGYVPPTPIHGRRDLPGGHLNVWRIPKHSSRSAEPSIPLRDSALIVVNFNKADPKGGASYGAIAMTDCATLEIWVKEWSTFASEYGLGSVIDQGKVSPSRQLLPGNEMTKRAAQWICDQQRPPPSQRSFTEALAEAKEQPGGITDITSEWHHRDHIPVAPTDRADRPTSLSGSASASIRASIFSGNVPPLQLSDGKYLPKGSMRIWRDRASKPTTLWVWVQLVEETTPLGERSYGAIVTAQCTTQSIRVDYLATFKDTSGIREQVRTAELPPGTLLNGYPWGDAARWICN